MSVSNEALQRREDQMRVRCQFVGRVFDMERDIVNSKWIVSAANNKTAIIMNGPTLLQAMYKLEEHLKKYEGLRRFTPFFKWFDMWVGAYWDKDARALYVCPLPMIGIKIGFY